MKCFYRNLILLFYHKSLYIFLISIQGCIINGCLNGGSCLLDERKQAFGSCSCKPPWTGDGCEVKLGKNEDVKTVIAVTFITHIPYIYFCLSYIF